MAFIEVSQITLRFHGLEKECEIGTQSKYILSAIGLKEIEKLTLKTAVNK